MKKAKKKSNSIKSVLIAIVDLYDSDMLFDEFKKEGTKLLKELTDEAYNEGYKQGMLDGIDNELTAAYYPKKGE